MPLDESIQAWPRRRWFSVAAALYLIASVSLATFLWLQMTEQRLPYFANSDQWVITSDVIQQSFLQFIRRGHNGVPSYFQNALTWLDYHLLDYHVTLPRLFVWFAWPLGTLVFWVVLRQAGASRTLAAVVLAFVITLWTAESNRENLVATWRAMESTGVWLLFGLGLLGWLRFTARQAEGGMRSSDVAWRWFFMATLSAWMALYLHGGFAVLPIVLLLLAYAGRKSRGVLAAAAFILVIFVWHYIQVHTMGMNRSGTSAALWEVAFGYLISTNPPQAHSVSHHRA